MREVWWNVVYCPLFLDIQNTSLVIILQTKHHYVLVNVIPNNPLSRQTESMHIVEATVEYVPKLPGPSTRSR